MKTICLIYNSFLIALTLSFICFRIVWLEMRLNIGMLIPVFMVLAFFMLMFIFRKKRFSKPYKIFTAINLTICAVISLIVLGVKSIGVVPASIIREMLKMPHLKFSVVDALIVGIIAIGFVMISFKRCDNET